MERPSLYGMYIKVLCACFFGTICAVVLFILLWIFSLDKNIYLIAKPVSDSHVDFMLALVTISLAAIGIMIALIAAAIGWASLRFIEYMIEKIEQRVQKEVIERVSTKVRFEANKLAVDEARNAVNSMKFDEKLKEFIVNEVEKKLGYRGVESQEGNGDPELLDNQEDSEQEKKIGESSGDQDGDE